MQFILERKHLRLVDKNKKFQNRYKGLLQNYTPLAF